MQFNRKYARWVADGRKPSAVADRRATNSGRFRAPTLTVEDRDKLVGHATLFHGGRASQAWKALSEKRELSPDLLNYYERSVASPDIPRAVRASVHSEIERLDDIHHGTRQTKLNGPHIDRDWSSVHAGDWYQSDDCTLPVYFYVPDGQGWFALMRGQFLPMIDLRSKCVLEFALLPSPNYNSQAIRTLITRTCDAHGLPRRGFYFENGIWKSSKIIAGESSSHTWNDTERGLRDLGLEFRHAKTPRAKPVEHVLGLLQDLMEGERGYIGRDERHERFERVQKQILLVRAAKEHPSKYFYSFEEWQLRLREICEKYNATAQRGKMTEGRAPEVAFEEFQNQTDPPIRFDASCRYLLAHHPRKLRVKRTGIDFKVGTQTYRYVNERTGQLVGEEVIAWFNPELPDVLCVTDLNKQNPFAVERLENLPAMDATPEQMASAHSQIAAHLAHAKTHYCTLKAKFAPKFRQNIVAAATVELGNAFNAEIGKAETKARETRGRFDRTHRAARALNLTPSQAALQRPEAAPALEGLPDILKELRKEEATAAVAVAKAPVKTYVLKSPPLSANIPQLRATYWKLAKQVESLGLNRHALTHQTLGSHPKVNDMTPRTNQQTRERFFRSYPRHQKGRGQMSNTRIAKDGGTFRQERYCSSPEFERGLMANLVAKRCSVLVDKKQREIVWFLQMLSWAEGGLERLARDLVAANPKNLRKLPKADAEEFGVDCDSGSFAVGELPNHLRDLCLNPQSSIERSPWYFAELFASLFQHQQSWVEGARRGVVTTLGQKVYDALDYAASTRRLVLIDGIERMGKTVAAKTWCAMNPGRARYVQCPSCRDEAGFFRAVGEALGVSINLKSKAVEIRERVEAALRCGDLLLVLDEAHYLWPQNGDPRGKFPVRINWLMTALINHGVPVALVTTPQFFEYQRALEAATHWRSGQFTGRIGHWEQLPESLTKQDLESVARFLAPEASATGIEAMVRYAQGSAKYLAGIDTVVCRARFIASKQGRTKLVGTDIANAISESVIPSDNALVKTFAAADRSRKRGSKTVAMPLQPQRTTEPATHRETEPSTNAPSRSVTPLAVP